MDQKLWKKKKKKSSAYVVELAYSESAVSSYYNSSGH